LALAASGLDEAFMALLPAADFESAAEVLGSRLRSVSTANTHEEHKVASNRTASVERMRFDMDWGLGRKIWGTRSAAA
jgi:hypothetical protein